MKRSALILGIAAVLVLPACSDDDPEPTPSPSASASASPSASPTGRAAATQTVHLVCPDPVGEADALTDPNDEWGPAYVIGSDTVLIPVAFGEITGTASDGATFTDPAKTKPGSDPAGAIECSFTGTFDGQNDAGEAITAEIEGTVLALVSSEPYASPSTNN